MQLLIHRPCFRFIALASSLKENAAHLYALMERPKATLTLSYKQMMSVSFNELRQLIFEQHYRLFKVLLTSPPN